MDSVYTRKQKIEFSDVDKHLNMKLLCAANFVQNNMTNLFGRMNIGNERIKTEHGVFWVVSKMKIHFEKDIRICEEIFSKTYISGCSRVRLNLEHVFCDVNKQPLFIAYQELCIIDVATRKVRPLAGVVEYEDVPQSNVSFSKIRWNIDEFTKVYSYTIMYDDLDSNGHVNNARYLSFVVNALGSEFFDRGRIMDIEVNYINECIEGAHINVYKKSFDGSIGVVIMSGQTEVLKAKLIVDLQ